MARYCCQVTSIPGTWVEWRNCRKCLLRVASSPWNTMWTIENGRLGRLSTIFTCVACNPSKRRPASSLRRTTIPCPCGCVSILTLSFLQHTHWVVEGIDNEAVDCIVDIAGVGTVDRTSRPDRSRNRLPAD